MTEEEAVQQEEAQQEGQEEESEFAHVLLFGRYDMSDIEISDGGLAKYVNLAPTMVPHSGGKHANKWFGKTKMSIVERLINNMMRTEDFTGKKTKAYQALRDAFAIVAEKTGKNPVQIFVYALENAAPREEITRLQFGGISVPKAVDISPSRRLDIALRNIARGSVAATYKNKKGIAQCMAEELMMASRKDMNSFSVAKKEEIERVAASAR
ncbi:MAG: 30S ribosomal protein S7 [Methanomassiliicoccales archaeon]